MMETKVRNVPKPRAAIHLPKKQMPSKLSEPEKKAVVELKKLFLETIKLDVELQREIYAAEKKYESKHHEIFQKRQKILQEYKKTAHGKGAAGDTINMSHFWLKVLKVSYTEFINKKDEKILMHLTDVRSKLYTDPVVKFVIEFDFEPNEFFTNRTLTKTYFLNCLPDLEDPLQYDGAEIFKCEGCKIDWKSTEKDRESKKGITPDGNLDFSGNTSFFDFFSPPEMPENPKDPNYNDINTILQNDFELGFYLKERVIPKAVMFFTGEIPDCQSSSDSDSDESDDDEDDVDDDDDDDDDEDASSDNNSPKN